MNKNTFHILVVDDDDRIRELVKEYLVGNNFLVTTAKDASDAKKRLQIVKFDILVGRQIIVENSSGSIEGNAHGISAEGALLLSNEDGIHQIISGSVRCINNETML